MLNPRDASVYVRQVIRDYGLTVAGARQVAKLVARAVGVKQSGRVQGIRRWPAKDYSMRVPFGFVDARSAPAGFRIAALCHMFYPALAAEFRAYLAHVPGSLDVVLSTDTEAKRDELLAAFAGWDKGDADVRVVPNRGRDIAPKLTAYGDVMHRYDLLLFLHSKRTVRVNDDGVACDQGAEWRRHLLRNLCGSPEIVASILEAFRHDPKLGMVMPQHWERVRDFVDWHREFVAARDLASRMRLRLSPAHVIDFPSGSMFWARPRALGPLFDLGLRIGDFPEESGQTDGTLAHVLERLFLFACEAAGYRWVKVCDVTTTTRPDTAVVIATPDDLDVFWRRHGFRLTAAAPQ